jgi:hypothetical protein
MLASIACYTAGMEDTVRHSPTETDIDRQTYSLSVRQAQALFDTALLPRSIRSITRYCESARLDAVKIDGPAGPEWKISETSVIRAVEELKRVHSVSDTAGHGQLRPVMSELKIKDLPAQTPADTVRHSPPLSDIDREGSDDRYVEQLERRIEEKDDVIGMLRGELVQRNEEIVRRNERERETNILIRGLQNLVLRLQPGSPPSADVLDGDRMTNEREVPDHQSQS